MQGADLPRQAPLLLPATDQQQKRSNSKRHPPHLLGHQVPRSYREHRAPSRQQHQQDSQCRRASNRGTFAAVVHIQFLQASDGLLDVFTHGRFDEQATYVARQSAVNAATTLRMASAPIPPSSRILRTLAIISACGSAASLDGPTANESPCLPAMYWEMNSRRTCAPLVPRSLAVPENLCGTVDSIGYSTTTRGADLLADFFFILFQ